MSTNIEEKVARIKQIYEEEQRNPKPVTKLGEIPGSYELITKEWLEAVLAKDTGAKLESFNLDVKDDGTANRRRIYLNWDEAGKKAGLPSSVFCKATHDLENRVNMSFGGVDGEALFYNKLRPEIGIISPEGLYAVVDQESYNSIIILKDLKDEVEFCNKTTYATRGMVEDQMRTLAKLHGKYYKSQDPDFLKLSKWGEGFKMYDDLVDVETAARNGWKASKSVIPAEFYGVEEEIWPLTVLSYERNNLLADFLVHSDVHLGNWFKTKDGKMGLQDYQCLSRGLWARDIAYCLGTAPTVADRRAWEKDLVKLYLAELSKAGGPKLSEELAWKEIKGQSFGALAYWTLTITPTEKMPVMQSVETCLVFIERLATQMYDWDALAAIKELGKDVSMYN